ncbi:hypothetical protein [Cryobacterium sp. AP23]
MKTKPADSEIAEPVGRARGRVLRLWLGGVLLVGYAVAAVWFYRECISVRTVDADGLVTSQATCAPPTLTSATVLVLLLLIAALLWPDISEITVLGVSLKRRIADAESRAEAATVGVDDLRATVQLQQIQIDAAITANSTASATVHNHFGGDDWGAAEQARLRKESARVGPRPVDSQTGLGHGSQDLERLSNSELIVTLLADYEAFAEILDLHTLKGRGRPTVPEAEKRQVQDWFMADHAPAIQTLRQLRNAVAHARDVPRDDVIDGLTLLRDLIPMSRQWLAQHNVNPET